MKVVEAVKTDLKTDVTWNRVGRLAGAGARAFPSASVQYLSEKLPIIGWLPRYNPRWILNDFIAGLTIGLMLIPQGLSYAKIAEIPVQYGLMSSWLPAVLYTFMGTTKDLSTGPTSLIGLLTSDNVNALQDRWTPSEIASATAFMMGVYGLALGFLKLGFLLEFISLPVLNGFISAVAITIILNQIPSFLGEENVGSGTATQIHDIFHDLPQANGWACLIGFSGIIFLKILEISGKKWGKQYKIVWFLSITRAFLCLVLFTGIGYAVNKNRDDFLFDVVKVQADGQEAPKMPRRDLLPHVAGRSIAVFIGAAIEHTAIARAFAVKNDYTMDQSQELCYFGLTNFANSFFHAMGVGGAMSRTAVNDACNVKSPLSGLVTMAVILVCIYELVGVLYWIPKATLAAIIILAVWGLISPPSTFYRFWKTSLADFIASMIAFWVALFVSTEVSIACAVGFNLVYCVLRQAFTRLTSTSGGVETRSELAIALDEARSRPAHIPPDTRVFRFNESLFFPNAHGNLSKALDDVQTFHAPIYNGSHGPEQERNWSVVGEKRLARLRKRAGVHDPSMLPAIDLIILDFGRVNHIDSTAVTHLRTFVASVKKYGGSGVEIRFVDMSQYVRDRFARANWVIIEMGTQSPDDYDLEESTLLYPDVRSALRAPRRRGSVVSETLKANAAHLEKVDA